MSDFRSKIAKQTGFSALTTSFSQGVLNARSRNRGGFERASRMRKIANVHERRRHERKKQERLCDLKSAKHTDFASHHPLFSRDVLNKRSPNKVVLSAAPACRTSQTLAGAEGVSGENSAFFSIILLANELILAHSPPINDSKFLRALKTRAGNLRGSVTKNHEEHTVFGSQHLGFSRFAKRTLSRIR